MDLLFNRYASPFLLLDQMIAVGRFAEFIDEFLELKNEEVEAETLFDMYLHHPFLEIGFDEWKKKCLKSNAQPQKKTDFGTTIRNSFGMLHNFVPT